ncbi:MAG: 16S rRNA (cytosine(1402)-N(4))-methyltransferase RsmH [bacterium]
MRKQNEELRPAAYGLRPEFHHISVFPHEAIEALKPAPGLKFIDCTLGGAGHTKSLLEASSPTGMVLAFDLDPEAIAHSKKMLADFGKRAVLVQASYETVEEAAKEHGFTEADGALMDLGVSSQEFDEAERGFSFRKEGPLDMRFSPDQELTAAVIVNSWSEEKLAEIFRELGEEKFAAQIAKRIVEAREIQAIETTAQLEDIVFHATPSGARHGKIHPATRVFQALRIATNDELGALERTLPKLAKVLKPGARLAVISFHSLEDRIVKRFMKSGEEAGRFKLITKKPIVPGLEEVRNNPRARSAKLRIAEIV